MSSADTIFLVGREGGLQEIQETAYDREELLQTLIAEYPSLMAGHQIDEDDPPRWMLVCREMGVPGEDGGSDRWSLDHLFLDQRGIPTLVEVKRATDTRIRREVVGQMLDYAANAQKYWPVERIRRAAEEKAGGAGPLAERVAMLLELPDDAAEEAIEDFWRDVDQNLRRGRLRLLFVADHIPTELRRIIEFLNDKMPDVHVVGLELVQYHRDGLRVLVPRVVGQTEAARTAKARAMGAGGLPGRGGTAGPEGGLGREGLQRRHDRRVPWHSDQFRVWLSSGGGRDRGHAVRGVPAPGHVRERGTAAHRATVDGSGALPEGWAVHDAAGSGRGKRGGRGGRPGGLVGDRGGHSEPREWGAGGRGDLTILCRMTPEDWRGVLIGS